MSEKISRNDMLFRNSKAKHPIEKIEVEKEKTKDKSRQEKQTNKLNHSLKILTSYNSKAISTIHY